MHQIGYTTGKFHPFHKGHEMLILLALSCCDELHIEISSSPDDLWPASQREGWIKIFLEQWSTPERVVVTHIVEDLTLSYAKDENGTITDPTFWEQWTTDTQNMIGDQVDFVFTSDLYGLECAKRLGAKWYPIDPKREVVNISATKIMSNPMGYDGYINKFARYDIGKTVAFVGPESVGKSTMVKQISALFNVPAANEWGRTVYEANLKQRSSDQELLTTDDFEMIFTMQRSMIEFLKPQSYLRLTDTEAMVTSIFYEDFFGSLPSDLSEYVADAMKQIHLYIVLAPTVALIDDGTRVCDQEHREDVFKRIIERLEHHNAKYVVIDDSDYVVRFNQAVNYIADLTSALR